MTATLAPARVLPDWAAEAFDGLVMAADDRPGPSTLPGRIGLVGAL